MKIEGVDQLTIIEGVDPSTMKIEGVDQLTVIEGVDDED